MTRIIIENDGIDKNNFNTIPIKYIYNVPIEIAKNIKNNLDIMYSLSQEEPLLDFYIKKEVLSNE